MLSTVTYVYAFDHPHGLPLPEVAAIVGGKAANLAVMAGELRLPVPPGFTICTAACRAYLASGWPVGLDSEIREHMSRLEAAVGRRFGDPADPLLVSIRSGAPVSMPGMMDTILNLGLNDSTAEGLAAVTGDHAFAEACRRRFSTMYRDIVGTAVVPDDPWQQLRGAIEAVFRSWNSDRARSYRAREGISDDLGTGVTVQAMVFGNRGSGSATGVIFTRNPATGDPEIYGDVLFDAQGEDVVAGTHQTEPFAVLEERMPAVAEELGGYADALEHHYADACDIEFTIEKGRLWMLQTRVAKRSPRAALRIAVEMAEDKDFPLSRAEAVERVARYLADPPTTAALLDANARPIASGLPASPGLASGEIATTPDAAVAMAEAGRSVLLVRRNTSPDDVHGMIRASGILTATGGLTSHAAVVARGWGIPAVVGAPAVRVDESAVSIGDLTLAVGDTLTIDGESGEIFAGAVASGSRTFPEVATLLSWARLLRIDIEVPEARTTAGFEPEANTVEAGVLTIDTVIRALLIRGFATAEDLAPVLFTTPAEVGTAFDRMATDGLVELSDGMFTLTTAGKALGAELTVADRRQWGTDKAQEAIDSFLPLDHRVKEIVTAWQVRDVDGRQVLNDHTDSAYDAEVLDQFGSFHRDAAAWLGRLGNALPRLFTYGARLDRAVRLTGQGDHLYIASPRVDSYHSIWFELHEDLIRLAGRTREDEAAAGRA